MNQFRRGARAVLLRAPLPIRRAVLRAFGRDLPRPPATPSSSADRRAELEALGFVRSYIGTRPELVSRLPRSCRNVLDLGCATGEVGAAVKRRTPEARVTGVELDPAMAALASAQLDRVVAADLGDSGAIARDLADGPFDGVIAGDILEHLVDPWGTLRALTAVLSADAWVVASLPNVGFWDTWWNVLVRKRWPYRSRGIHDATHLRFFARRNIEPLFGQAGYRVERIDRVYRLVEQPQRRNRLARWLAIPGLRDLLTFQFLVVARLDAHAVVSAERGVTDDGELRPPD